ncbi:glutathione S-transferase family protein [Gammaproteobacteria bacterium]|nr:glutathione S-transferase family protein [Gammaproteobacteria bacterium]MDA7709482.1 glutathione S-transferase family protein [Gammaproteobacteria bacterium]MDA7734881.1 glutathione S-transferase family protein [Gammaproteobacteria bacterium]MDA7821770.1 glutathione S-transferase family protein [Gammaproteobacteria bacterium]MDA7857048.1 glutathione S-transferase family protein [Gammaproteobacteria bacterium]|tara:strand:+ start:15498 stop:16109 length:612 start_codon:yes stop_codon:yes gene_type:complete
MKLYSSKFAPNPRKVLIYLKEKNISDIEIIDLDLGKLEHKTPEYRAIAPNSRVPALQLDDGTVILETTAMCRYLECLYPEPNMFGESPIEIASIEMWYSRVSFELMVPLMHGFRHTHPHMSTMENQNEEYGLAQRKLGIKELENYDTIIQSREFIAGDRFTYADLQMVTSLQFLVRLNKLDIEDYGNLNEYIIQVSSRPSFLI